MVARVVSAMLIMVSAAGKVFFMVLRMVFRVWLMELAW